MAARAMVEKYGSAVDAVGGASRCGSNYRGDGRSLSSRPSFSRGDLFIDRKKPKTWRQKE